MVSYFNEDNQFTLKGKLLNNKWLKIVCESEIKKLSQVNIIFCSDNYILDINIRYLHHDYFTDIITFDYCEGDKISGDLFISIDSVKDNADHYDVDFNEELDRVMVHGILHLIGYDDHSPEQISTMREKENYYLELKRRIQ